MLASWMLRLPCAPADTMVESCRVDFEVSHANKGFEGIQYHEDQDGGAQLVYNIDNI